LFKKFSRLAAQPTGGESSTGLGLAIVKRLAEAMSGSVQCHSELGAGAKFTLRLPIWPHKVETAPEGRPEKSAIPKVERAEIQELLPPGSMRN
jgi:K+-sensing histidine kinase KdpD